MYAIKTFNKRNRKRNTVVATKCNNVIIVFFLDEEIDKMHVIKNEDIFTLADELLSRKLEDRNIQKLADTILNLMVVQYEVSNISDLHYKKYWIEKNIEKKKNQAKYKDVSNYIFNYINRV